MIGHITKVKTYRPIAWPEQGDTVEYLGMRWAVTQWMKCMFPTETYWILTLQCLDAGL